jgi:ribosomal protein L11 methyltransferase
MTSEGHGQSERETQSDSQWVTVSITVPVDDVDLASGMLWDAGAAGIEERAADEDDDRELRAGLLIDSVDAVRSTLRPDWVISVETVEADEGLDAWREFARPWRAGSRLVIVPSWIESPDWCREDDLALSIDPGRSFGSGSHPTTRMCLAELEQLVHVGDSVADIGCGSGVLSVAAVCLGAANAVGVDIDEEAIAVSRNNAERVGVADRVTVLAGSIDAISDSNFDVVVANIAAHVLLAMATALAASVKPEGTLLLSGVLDEQVDDVLGAFQTFGFALVRTVAEDDWRALVMRRAN